MDYRNFFANISAAGLLLFCTLVQADAGIATTVSNIYTLPFNLDAGASTDTLVVPVSESDQLIIGIESGDTPIDVVVTDPSGTQLDASVIERFTIAPGAEPPLGAVLFAAGEHISFTIDNPLPGDWKVALTLPAGSPDVNGALTRITLGGVSVRLLTSRASYREDQAVVMSALVFNGTAPVPGATVTADIFTESSVLLPDYSGIVLRDDGIDPDAAAEDGVYTAVLGGLTPGHYFAEAAIVTGNNNAVGSTRFDIATLLATFTGSVSDSGVDDNSDGLADRIALQFGVAVTRPGDYAATALLEKNGHSVNAGARVTLTDASTSVEISFPADDIREFLGEDGPYNIANVQLVNRAATAGDDETVADRLVNLGQTRAYTLSSLQRPVTLISAGMIENAVDHDANGLYDTLIVKFTVDTLTPSSYLWSGDIRTAGGTVLGVANNSGYLAAGANTVTLAFKGNDIGRGGKDGPYQVANVAAYGNNGGTDVLDVLGETRPYLAADFEGGIASFELLKKEVTELVITGIGGVPRAEGIRSSLLKKLEIAERHYLEKNRTNAALNLVDAFSHEVTAQSGHHINTDAADRLIMLARELAASLEH